LFGAMSLGDTRSVPSTASEWRSVQAQDRRANDMGARRDAAMLCRYAQTRDPQLCEQLVHRYLPLARYAASQYASGPESFDDLLQVASLGLLKALDRFDPGKGAAFSSYALPTMSGELRRHFRDRGWAVRPPRGLQEQALRVDKAAVDLQRTQGRSPTVAELAAETGLDDEAVLEAREALCGRHPTSLSASPADHDGDESALERRLGRVDDGYAGAEDRAVLAPLLRRLPIRDRVIVRLRFEHDLTQSEIGERVGLSQMHVSRVLRIALEQLRAEARRVT
jgi:RNA polymerase sigma-B factor